MIVFFEMGQKRGQFDNEFGPEEAAECRLKRCSDETDIDEKQIGFKISVCLVTCLSPVNWVLLSHEFNDAAFCAKSLG